MSGQAALVLATDLLDPDLTDFERKVLRWGVIEWGGPAACTDELAIAMGFESVQDLFDQTDRLVLAIESGHSMAAVDWLRALLACEIAWSSNTVGSGLDWEITFGHSDAETLAALRSIQCKLAGLRQLVGVAFGTRYRQT